jgi:hypothetical protein
MEREQRSIIRFFMEEGMKGVEIIDGLNEYYGRDAIQ